MTEWLIDMRALKPSYMADDGRWMVSLTDIVNAPRVDAVRVVRCKDCVRRGNREECPLLEYFANELDEFDTDDDGHCYFGERKDGAKTCMTKKP